VAVQVDERWWEFVTSADGKILAEAWDLAGNVTKQEQ
jgi:hypothetical protein